jgi:hypothetical protein
MKIILQYHLRLGDIIRLFPLARHLAGQGKTTNEVFIECDPKYHSIFGLVDYVKPKHPQAPLKDAAGKPLYDALYPLQIWPAKAQVYRSKSPPLRFLDFVTSGYPEDFRGLRREIVFDRLPPIEPILAKYKIPAEYSIACPAGFCENIRGDYGLSRPIDFYIFESWLNYTIKPRGAVFFLSPLASGMNRRFVHVSDLSELASLIRHALDFATILSAPAVIASARFEKKPLREKWHYVSPIDPTSRALDDIGTKEQTRWEVELNAATPRIVPQK